MIQLINRVLFYGKTILLLISFSLVMYISFSWCDYYNYSLINILSIFIPFLMVLIIFVVSYFFNNTNNDLIFNLGCFLSLLGIIIISLRTILDTNMILWVKGNMNFYFFESQLKQIKILCYLIFIGNLLIIYKERKEKK